MQNTEERLAGIGFGASRSDEVCWRCERLEREGRAIGPVKPSIREPMRSAALMRWRDILAGAERPSPYRISRA